MREDAGSIFTIICFQTQGSRESHAGAPAFDSPVLRRNTDSSPAGRSSSAHNLRRKKKEFKKDHVNSSGPTQKSQVMASINASRPQRRSSRRRVSGSIDGESRRCVGHEFQPQNLPPALAEHSRASSVGGRLPVRGEQVRRVCSS